MSLFVFYYDEKGDKVKPGTYKVYMATPNSAAQAPGAQPAQSTFQQWKSTASALVSPPGVKAVWDSVASTLPTSEERNAVWDSVASTLPTSEERNKAIQVMYDKQRAHRDD